MQNGKKVTAGFWKGIFSSGRVSIDNSVTSSTLLIMFLSLVGYVAGFLTQIVIAQYFGVSKELDLFVAAAIIPEFIFGITNAMLFTSFVVIFPKYIKEKGEQKGKEYLNNIMSLASIGLIIVTIFIVIFSPLIARIIGPGFTAAEISLLSMLIKVLSISVLFFGLSSIVSAVLHHEHKFSTPKLFRTFLALGIIGIILVLQKHVGVISLAIGMVLGSALGLCMQWFAMKKEGYKFSFTININDPYLKKLLYLSWPLIITSIFYYVNKTVANMIASTLGTGSLSILNYAFLVMNIAVTVIAGSIATAIFPFMAKQMAHDEKEKLASLFSKSTSMTIFLVVPLMIIMMLLNREIIHVLFERGAFLASSTKEVGITLILFSIGLIPISVMNVIVNVYHATERMKQKMYLFLLLLFVNITLNLVFSRFWSYNGIALGMVVSYWIVSGVGFYYIANKVEEFTYSILLKELSKIILATGVMFASLYFVHQSMISIVTIGSLSVVGKLLTLLFLITMGLVPYLIMAIILKSESIKILQSKLHGLLIKVK